MADWVNVRKLFQWRHKKAPQIKGLNGIGWMAVLGTSLLVYISDLDNLTVFNTKLMPRHERIPVNGFITSLLICPLASLPATFASVCKNPKTKNGAARINKKNDRK